VTDCNIAVYLVVKLHNRQLLKMNKKKRFLLVSLYIVFLVVLFEGFARLTFSIPQVSERLWVRDELSWRRFWISRHQNKSKKVTLTFDNYDSTKGWISKPNVRDMKVFDNKVLNTNSKRVRGKNEYPYSKDPDKVRILTLGDSFTFGHEVSDSETYSYYLQEMIPQTEIINLGVHGYGHDQMLILLKEEGIKYEPDIIILGFLTMDMSRNLLNFRDYAKPKFVVDNKELRLKNSPVPSPQEIIKWDWIRPRIVDMLSIIRHVFRHLSGLQEKREEEITTALLTEIIKLADSIHAIPIVAYLPARDEISVDTALMPGEKYLLAMCQTNDRVRCFSTRPYFAEKMTKGVTFKKGYGHWGPAGHLAVAEAIKRYLVDGGYVPLRNSLEKSDITKPNKTMERMR
jgi:hypothetical protein